MEFWKRRNRQAIARERLKRKGVVPIKKTTGKKLFETFLKEAYNIKNKSITEDDLRNIFNASHYLTFDEWIW